MIQRGAVAPQSLSYAFHILKVPVQILSSGKRKPADHIQVTKKATKSRLK